MATDNAFRKDRDHNYLPHADTQKKGRNEFSSRVMGFCWSCIPVLRESTKSLTEAMRK